MTKQIELKGKTCLLVEVPEEAHSFRTDNDFLYMKLRSHDVLDDGSSEYYEENKLPPGNWRILGSGKASEISESDWKEIVEEFYYPLSADIMGYKNYPDMDLLFDAPTESGLSLLSYNGFKKESTVILVKE